MQFTLRQIEALVAIATDGSVSAAANRLDISQAAVSGLISGLEASLGLALVQRQRGAKAVLTGAGELLLPQARAIMAAARGFETAAGRVSTNRAISSCVIGARPYIIDWKLRDIVARFQQRHPQMAISLQRGSNSDLLADFVNGKLLAALFLHDEEALPVPHRTILSLGTGLYVSADHPLAGREHVSLQEVSTYGFIFPPADTPLEKRIIQILQQIGLEAVKVAARTEYAEAVMAMTIAGAGVGLLFDMESNRQSQKRHLAQLPLATPHINLLLAQQHSLSASEAKLLNFIEAELVQAAGAAKSATFISAPLVHDQ